MMDETQIRELSEAVESNYGIECTRCGNDTYSMSTSSQYQAAKEFYETGWRTDFDDTLCPDCAETV